VSDSDESQWEVSLKFVSFSDPVTGGIHLGCHWGPDYLDITRAAAEGLLRFPGTAATIEDVLHVENGLESLESKLFQLRGASQELHGCVLTPRNIVLKAPILHPEKLIGIGLNYRDHAEEAKIPIPKTPLLFGMYANAIVGPEDPIVIPPATQQVDYEAELAVVIGSRACRVPVDQALRYVAGYTIVNDVSARDLQFGDKQWTRGKSIDTFAPMGPCLVTRNELGSAGELGIELRLNGQTLQKSNTRNLIFDVPALVSHISQTMTLVPGDVISTGTPSGVGYVRNPPVFLKAGDSVEIEIEGIGVLRNPVAHLD
jgi:2-keto-4-pentenoate hydratase/2-oxohepta-3-ene-1,7-dioic acid hydratase in catechol pathway